MNSLEVRYFALLKEITGQEKETVEITTEKTYADLYQSLAERHQFPLTPDMVQVAVNDEFSDMQGKIQVGARVVFIPPVAGG